MSSIIDFIHSKQKEGENIKIHFKSNSSVYITPESSITLVSEGFAHIISDVSLRGAVDDIYNINDIARISIVEKKG